ncbi:MAG: hypothetical protein WD845_02655 [Pirellulales bacterium]
MGSHSLPVDSDPAYPDWQQIEDALDQLAEAAKSTRSSDEFYRLLLDRIVPAGGISGAAVWTAPRIGELRLARQLDADRALQLVSIERRQQLVEQVLQSGQPCVAAAGDDTVDRWIILHPFRSGLQVLGVVELVQCRVMSSPQRAGHARLLAALVELIEDFHRHRELGQLRESELARAEYDRFALGVHRSLQTSETAFAIANDGRRVAGCDRASVLLRHGKTYRVAAISGVDLLDRRAKQVRALEQLTTRAMAVGEPLWYSDGAVDLPEEVERPLQVYLDASHARVLAIVPLYGSASQPEVPLGPPIGALLAEQFQVSPHDEALRDRLTAVAAHAGVALVNAQTHSHQPLARVGRLLARCGWLTEARQLPKTALVLAAIAAVVAALVVIPADFDIEAKGELQPKLRREVFASDDGIVSELLIDHGRKVNADEPLVVLRKPELDLELRRVAGEVQTVEKKLAAVQAERLSNARATPDDRRDAHQRTADEEELKEQLKGLADQRELLLQQREALVIRSPLAGETLTWNVHELLAARPVERGQALLTVADVEGPWVVELRVPDNRTGHVLAAGAEAQSELDVSFALSAEPGVEYQGKLTDIALATELDDVLGPTVLATVAFDRDAVAGLRPGATVLARIHCGRRPLGYVWLHDLYEFVQTHWWW